MTFDLSGSSHKHKAGDVLFVKPQNHKEAVDEFLSVMNLDPSQLFTLEQNDPGTLHY